MGNVYAITAQPYGFEGRQAGALGGLPEALQELSAVKRERQTHEANLELAKIQREALEQEMQQSRKKFRQEQRGANLEFAGERQAFNQEREAKLAQQAQREEAMSRLPPKVRERIQTLDRFGPALSKRLPPETLEALIADEKAQMQRELQAEAVGQLAQGIEDALVTGEIGDEAEAQSGEDGKPGPLVQFADALKKGIASGEIPYDQGLKMLEARRVEVEHKTEIVGQKQKGFALIQQANEQVANDPSLGVAERQAKLDALNRREAQFKAGTLKWESLAPAIEQSMNAKTPKQAAADQSKMRLAIKGQAFDQAMKLRAAMPEPRRGQPDTRPSIEELVALRERALMQALQGGGGGEDAGQALDFADRSGAARQAFDPMAAGQIAGRGRAPAAGQRSAGAQQRPQPSPQAQKGAKPAVDRRTAEQKAMSVYRSAIDAGKSEAEASAAMDKVLADAGIDPEEIEPEEPRDPSSIQGM